MRGSGRFGDRHAPRHAPRGQVSIPFIAGQWSLLPKDPTNIGRSRTFQSPSLRGSGRFVAIAFIICVVFLSFNPLHCGAVVASRGKEEVMEMIKLAGFNPLHCGAVVASGSSWLTRRGSRKVSIPFIAGQWSLRGPGDAVHPTGNRFQSPSLRGSGRFPTNSLGLGGSVGVFQSPSLRGSGRFISQCSGG